MKINNRQQLLAVLAIAAVALFAADKALLTPLTRFWKARADRLADLRKQVNDGANLLRREQIIRDRWEFMRTNTLNAASAEQQVLNAIDQWSRESRISILSQAPQWKQDSDDYKTLEYRVDAAGDLTTVSRFLYDIERDPLALKLQSVEIRALDDSGQQLSLGLQLSGLVLTPTGQQPQP